MRLLVVLALLLPCGLGAQSQFSDALNQTELSSPFFTGRSLDPADCDAGTVINPGPIDLCPSNFVVFDVAGGVIPDGGGYAFNFTPGPGGSGATGGAFGISGSSTWLLAIDNDLGGILSANSLPPFSGTWIIEGVVYCEAADPAGSVCSLTGTDLAINFLDGTSGCDACDAGSMNPSADQLVLDGEQAFALTEGVQIPAGGSMAYNFSPGPDGTGGLAGGFNLTGSTPIFSYDSDVNGVMSGNGLDPLHGTWIITPIAADVEVVPGELNLCDAGQGLTVYFMDDTDCATLANGSAPYWPTDPIFLQTTAENSACCNSLWDGTCQAVYDGYFFGCTYTQASNYSPLAQDDDGTCVFCEGDANHDGVIDVQDILSVLAGFGESGCSP